MRPLLSVFLGLVVRGGIYWRTIKSLDKSRLIKVAWQDVEIPLEHPRSQLVPQGLRENWTCGLVRPKLKWTDFLPKTERYAFDLMDSKLSQLQKLHKTLKRIWRRFYLRPHVFPSICSLKVGWQVHWYEPGEFVQLWWHPPLSCDIKERVNWGTGLSK